MYALKLAGVLSVMASATVATGAAAETATRLLQASGDGNPPVRPAMAVAPAQASDKARKDGEIFRDCDRCPEMVVVPAGSFTMGAAADTIEAYEHEKPARVVRIARRFAIGRHEVTRSQYELFVDVTKRDLAGCSIGGVVSRAHSVASPGFKQEANHPVVCVSWVDARDYSAWLGSVTGRSYRLPSAAEWEYAARAGAETRFTYGPALAPEAANQARLNRGTTPVGSYKPNAFKLQDVHGNVAELVQDCWFPTTDFVPADGGPWQGRDQCANRVVRDGGWMEHLSSMRLTARRAIPERATSNFVGFRVARDMRE